MEILFLFAGLAFIAVGGAIVGGEIQARGGTEAVSAQIVGFSKGRSSLNAFSFHSVAEYIAPNGRKYYVENSVGSSAPLHNTGDSVTVLVRLDAPEKAVLRSSLSYILGSALAAMGSVCVLVFWLTFRANTFSVVTAVLLAAGLMFKVRKVWRKEPISMSAWREYKKQTLSPRVFESSDAISWADAASLAAAVESYKKSNRFAIPILLCLGAVLLGLSYYAYQRTETFLQRAERAAGKVVDLADTSDDDTITYSAVVEFPDHKGQQHRFVDSIGSSSPLYTRGEAVNVLYDRDNPAYAKIDRGASNNWLGLLLGSSGGVFTLLGLWSLRHRRRYFANRTA